VQLPSSLQGRVEVHLSESAGKIRVTVRSADPELTSSLRAELTGLVQNIRNLGLQIEAWSTADTWPMQAENLPEIAATETASQSSDARSGSSGEGQQGSRGQHRDAQDRWLAEFERRLEKE
jgi:hypothetical protein